MPSLSFHCSKLKSLKKQLFLKISISHKCRKSVTYYLNGPLYSLYLSLSLYAPPHPSLSPSEKSFIPLMQSFFLLFSSPLHLISWPNVLLGTSSSKTFGADFYAKTNCILMAAAPTFFQIKYHRRS